MSTPAVVLEHVSLTLGGVRVLDDVSLEIGPRDHLALLGPNGGGKTTTLKVASGQLPATAGCVHLVGRHINGANPDALARLGVCTIPEGRGVFPNLSVKENLRMVTYGGAPLSQVEERAYATFPRLGERRSQLAGTMSGGEQAMLTIGRSLMSNPSLMIFDEPSLGLSPLFVKENFRIIKNINEKGMTVLLVEQNVRQTLEIAHFGYVLSQGKIVASGSVDLLKNNSELRAAYFGSA